MSLGFDITTVTYLVSRAVFEEGDRLLFVLPGRDVPGRTRQTLSALEEFLSGVIARGSPISYEFVRVSDRDIISDLIRLLDLVNRLNPSSIYVWAVGGTRSIVSLLTIYSFLDPRVASFISYSESNNMDIHVDRMGFIKTNLSKDVGMVLEMVDREGAMTLRELERSLGMEYGKVYRLASKAVKMGLLMKSRGRGGKYELTNLGRLYLKLLEIRST